jgi:hypothetical protein
MDREELAEGYVIASNAGLYLLRRLALEGALPASELEELCGGWEDWRHVVKLVEAGFAIDSSRGLMVSTKALKFADKLFDS